MREIGIALLGLGNVGLGTYQILDAHRADIERRLGARVRVCKVLVRDPKKAREGVPAELVTTDFGQVLADPDVSIVVELMGGVTDARSHVLASIEHGKHVVTANKALLATHGEEVFGRALKKGVDLLFEGAVCGGIPIIRTLREGLASDRLEEIAGIVNGTTNFILSAMSELKQSYSDALAQAQKLGYAEADPTLDVNGADAAQKLSLLASLGFMARLSPASVWTEGITGLTPLDIALGHEFGYVVKLLAIARRVGEGQVEARVHPAFIPRGSPLSEVRGAFNAVMLRSAALGPSLFSGQGAGALPTGSAVVSDVIDACRNLLAGVSGRLPMLCAPHLQDVQVRPISQREGAHYLRFTVSDEPGVLGKIATVLGERGVSIASVVQRQPEPNEGKARAHATIALFTHRAPEGELAAAVKWIDTLRSTRAPTQHIRIEPLA
jgi:homoserine dehydrogenase